MTSSPGSRRLKTGFQYDPVDSIATTLTPWAVSQSERFNRSPVMVAKVLTFLVTLPAGSTLRTQATTVRLWMSSPAQQACNTSIEGSPQEAPRTERHRGEESICSTCSAGIGSDAVGRQVRVRAMSPPG